MISISSCSWLHVGDGLFLFFQQVSTADPDPDPQHWIRVILFSVLDLVHDLHTTSRHWCGTYRYLMLLMIMILLLFFSVSLFAGWINHHSIIKSFCDGVFYIFKISIFFWWNFVLLDVFHHKCLHHCLIGVLKTLASHPGCCSVFKLHWGF